MRLLATDPVTLLCDRCQAPIVSAQSHTVAIGCGEIKVLHTPSCAGLEYQFVTANGASIRELTLTAFLAEVTTAMGL